MTYYLQARVWALRSAAVGRGKAELTEAEEEAERRRYADQAMKALRRAPAGIPAVQA